MSSQLLSPDETFTQLGIKLNLDPRLLKSLSRQGYTRPTLVQSKCLPLAILSGRDLLVRARTGSGKTLAYCLPVISKILTARSKTPNGEDDDEHVRCVILVPTRELCEQVLGVLQSLCHYCSDVISFVSLSGTSSAKKDILTQEALLRDKPDIIISTPAGLLQHLKEKRVSIDRVESLVVDEADLVLSFGYCSDVSEIVKFLPKICQGFLMSATLSPELESLKRVVLHSPAVLKLEEEEVAGKDGKGDLMQYYLEVPKMDKLLALYVFLKLGLLKGKGIFFVNSTNGGYRLKLFLEQFHIPSAILNAELPLRSRLSIMEQFNVGNFDYLIATDESTSRTTSSATQTAEEEKEEESKNKKNGKKRKRQKDKEYGASRGLDFRNVSFVVNFDFPETLDSYTHRIGRTARGGAKGVALSLLQQSSEEESTLLQTIQASQPALPNPNGTTSKTLFDDAEQDDNIPQPSPLEFDLSEIEGFRYRVEDVSRAVTRTAVAETRAAEVQREILNSETLKTEFFADHESDQKFLKKAGILRKGSRIQDHLKNVPAYLCPRGMEVASIQKSKGKKKVKKDYKKKNATGGRNKDNDPLQVYDGAVDLDGLMEVDGEESEEEVPVKEARVFMDTGDGLGESTAGRNRWKERHGKGKFSKKVYKGKNKGRMHGKAN